MNLKTATNMKYLFDNLTNREKLEKEFMQVLLCNYIAVLS